MNHLTPIIYTTDKCNMACKYCYTGCHLSDAPDIDIINKKFTRNVPILKEFTDMIMLYNNGTPTRFIFHGGEPLLICPENYRVILEFFKDKGYSIETHIQTNGTLIDDHFIDLFKEFKIKIGVSLDGLASINDRTRIFRSGKGTFSTIFRNLMRLKEEGISFGCLLTLSKSNINNLEESYNFFKKYSIPFNIRQIFKSTHPNLEELLITPVEYATAICNLFDIWFDDETDEFLINEFAGLIAQFIKPIEGLVSCSFTKDCPRHFISFDLDGNLCPCNRLYGINCFSYGNIQNNDLLKILNNSCAKDLSDRWPTLENTECKNCSIARYCNGGCPGNGYFYFDSYFKKDYFCDAYKRIMTHVYDKVRSTL